MRKCVLNINASAPCARRVGHGSLSLNGRGGTWRGFVLDVMFETMSGGVVGSILAEIPLCTRDRIAQN